MKKTHTNTCHYCNQPFTCQRSDTKFCKPSHRVLSHIAKEKKWMAAEREYKNACSESRALSWELNREYTNNPSLTLAERKRAEQLTAQLKEVYITIEKLNKERTKIKF